MFDPSEAPDQSGAQPNGRYDVLGSEDFADAPIEELEHAYVHLDALENAVRSHKLRVLAALDERDVAKASGAIDTADWVAMSSRVRTNTAKTLVRCARRLRDLPAIHRTADEGRLSLDQLVPLTKIADAGSDERWAVDGPGTGPATLDALVQGRRHVTTEEAQQRHRGRSLRWWWDERNGMMHLSGRLHDEAGEIVVTALERIRARQQPNENGLWDAGDERAADALVELAAAELADDADSERACIVLHVPQEGPPTFAGGDVPVAPDTARRLACDATLQALIEDALGNPVGMSARRRTVSPALKRALRHRDRRCRFPGCERTRGVHAHHVVHAADGGPTTPENLACLCRAHHRLVHEGGWRMTGDPTSPDGLTFRRPDGRVVTTHGPPLDPDTRRQFLPAA